MKASMENDDFNLEYEDNRLLDSGATRDRALSDSELVRDDLASGSRSPIKHANFER